jgi:hypothetical protein
MPIRLTAFTGEVPRVIPRLLPESAAQQALDVRLEDGDLRPIRKKKIEFTDPGLPTSGPATIYKFLEEWLFWNSFVNAAPGPVATDRLYYTGDGTPKMYTGGNEYEMKIVAPPTKLTGVVTGVGSGEAETRLYVYTNVSEFGEESEPSPISDPIIWEPGQTVTLSGFVTAMGDRTATFQRIYRSQTSLSGDTTLYFIDERAADTADYVDTIDPSLIQEPLPSLDWNQPPDNLSGLISLPNGMMAAFSGKKLYFCEPYIPHAWPEKYVLTFEHDLVALGAFGNTVQVTTKGLPYVVQGSAPENMVSERLELNLPCINAAGAVDLGYTFAYPTHEGLVVASSGGAAVGTKKLFTKPSWLRLDPSTFVAGQYDGRYMASYEYTDASNNTFSGSIIIDLTGSQPFLIRSQEKAIAFFYEEESGKLFFLKDDQNIYEWDPVDQTYTTMVWKSKEFIFNKPVKLGFIKIETNEGLFSDEEEALLAQRQAIIDSNQALMDTGNVFGAINQSAINDYSLNGDALQQVPGLTGSTSVLIYADKVLIATVTDVNKLKRFTKKRATVWEIEVSSDIPVSQVTVASTAAEMRAISNG